MSYLANTSETKPDTASKRPRRRTQLLPYMLVLPIILFELVMMIYPIIQGFIGSFQRIELASNVPNSWVGFANYQRMFSDPEFWKVMRVTLAFTASVVIVAISVGLITALLFNRPFKFRPIARAAMMVPWAFPDVPVVMIFLWILSPQFGIMNVPARLLPWVETNPQWLLNPTLAFTWVVLIASWKAFPFYSLVILSALQAVPQELYEAADVDGASRLQQFWHITLPSIRSTLELLVVLASIFSFKQFTIIYLLTGGGPTGATETIVLRIYNSAFRFYDYSYATALGVAGFVVSLIITFFFVTLQLRNAKEGA
jgi:multiple sugar transport system permease protein